MKIDWSLILTVIVALLIFEVAKKLFLNNALDRIGSFEDADSE